MTRVLAVVGYLVGFLAQCLWWGGPTDTLLIFGWLSAAVLCCHAGQPWRGALRWMRDWGPVLALPVGYDYSRGLAGMGWRRCTNASVAPGYTGWLFLDTRPHDTGHPAQVIFPGQDRDLDEFAGQTTGNSQCLRDFLRRRSQGRGWSFRTRRLLSPQLSGPLSSRRSR